MIDTEDLNPDWVDEQESWDGSVVRDDQGLSESQEELVPVSIVLNAPIRWSIHDCGLAARKGHDTPRSRSEWSTYYHGLYRTRGPDPGVYNTLLRRHGVWALPNPAPPGHPDHQQWCSDGLFLADVDFLLGAWMDRLHLGGRPARPDQGLGTPSTSLMSSRVPRPAAPIPTIDRPDFQHADHLTEVPKEIPDNQLGGPLAPPSSLAEVTLPGPTSSELEDEQASERQRRRTRQALLDQEDRVWEAETLRMRRRWDALQHGWDILFRGSSVASPGSEVDVLERASRDADRRRRVEWMKSAAFCQALLFLAPEENWLWMADVLHSDNRIILCRLIAKQASLSDASRDLLVKRWRSAGWIDRATAEKITSAATRRGI